MKPNPALKSNLPDDFEQLEFSVEDESWNEYELSDGTRIKARIILKRISKDPNNPKSLMFDLVPPFFTVLTPSANRGERDNEPHPSEGQLSNFEVKIIRSDEKMNLYRILKTGELLRIKLSVAKISRATGRFDKDGLPYYLINSGPTIVLDPSDKKETQ
ncbi:hypothetical protein JYT57_00190 [Nitrosarchaeum koreense]|nr:hypothetical protein [Nitrosarchaeum koreense]